MIEKIAEMPITEWEGARIRVTVEVPHLRNSLSTMRYVDRRELEQLKALLPPKHLEMLLDKNPDLGRFQLMRWDQEKEKAKNLLKAISDQIAWQIGEAIAKGG